MTAEDFHCPHCDSTIRATGGAEALYETDDDMNKVVAHDLRVFSDVEHEEMIDYLYYCPDEDCPVWRLFPLNWGDDE